MKNKIYHQDTKTPRKPFSGEAKFLNTLCLGAFVVKNVFIFILLFVLLLFTSQVTSAEIYKWTDDEGVIHVTDDPTKIPDKYWIERKVRKEEVKPGHLESQPKQSAQPTPAKEEKPEFYGDYPLDWWAYKFRDIKKNISDSEERVARGKNFIDVFEGGRRFGKVFTSEEISRYESYKAELPALEEKLKNLKDELEELQRKATIYGVPRNIRE